MTYFEHISIPYAVFPFSPFTSFYFFTRSINIQPNFHHPYSAQIYCEGNLQLSHEHIHNVKHFARMPQF